MLRVKTSAVVNSFGFALEWIHQPGRPATLGNNRANREGSN